MEATLDAKTWPDGRRIKFARVLKPQASTGDEFCSLKQPRTRTYEFARTPSSERLVVGIPEQGTDLVRLLAKRMGGPFRILYVLMVGRIGSPEGRYELLGELDEATLDVWLDWFKEALDHDGRHTLWVKCVGDGLIVYDRHELLFIYGDVTAVRSELADLGYTEGEVRTDFEHQHSYWPDYDALERYIASSVDFRYYPLVVGSDL